MRMLKKATSRQDLGWWKHHLWDRLRGWCGVGCGGGWAQVFSHPVLFSPQAKLKHKMTVMYGQINGAVKALEDVRARQKDVRVSDKALHHQPWPWASLRLQAGQAQL